MITYINKQYLPLTHSFIGITDRAYNFSDGVYEVILMQNGKLIDFDLHIDRLRYSLGEIALEYRIYERVFRNIINELRRLNRLDDVAVYIQISRNAYKREHVPAKN